MREYQDLFKKNNFGEIISVKKLSGGFSSFVLKITTNAANNNVFLLRKHGKEELAVNPNVAVNEFRLFQFLNSHSIKSQKVYLYQDFPESFLILNFVEGNTNFDLKKLDLFAKELYFVHNLKFKNTELEFLMDLKYFVDKFYLSERSNMEECLSEKEIRKFLENCSSEYWDFFKQDTVLLHGDYWEGNVLWNNGEIAALIDWENSCLGSRYFDVCNMRLELLFEYGYEVAKKFTDGYSKFFDLDKRKVAFFDLIVTLKFCGNLENWGFTSSEIKVLKDKHYPIVCDALMVLDL